MDMTLLIGENGIKLSGGERQRIAIARALLKNPPILILDEATSNLDTDSERAVQQAIEELMKGRTTLVVAHRLSTIRNADRIYVLKDGRVAEEGSHDKLLALDGEFARLYHMQLAPPGAILGNPFRRSPPLQFDMNSSRFMSRALAMPPAACYNAVQKIRAQAYRWRILRSRKAAVPVLSVGNLLMGGSGKTPFAIYLAGLLLRTRFPTGNCKSRLRGSNREKFLVVCDGSSGEPLVGPSVSGDEPFLMAKRLPKIPVLVGRTRIHAVEAAERLFGCDVVVLDDGFQHLQLERDLDIVLLNGTEDRHVSSRAAEGTDVRSGQG